MVLYVKTKKSKMSKDAKQDKAIAKIQKSLKPELKHYFVGTATSITFNYDGIISGNLFTPAQGVTISDRVGDKAYLIGAKVRMMIRGNATQSHFVRHVCFLDATNNITTVASLLPQIGATIDGQSGAPNSAYNPDVLPNATIKKDFTIDCVVGENLFYVKDYYFKIGRQVTFSSTGTLALKNAVRFIFITDGNTNLPSVQYLIDFMFTDS